MLLALTGTGGPDLTPFAAENFSFMSTDFEPLTTPSLIVAGDHDDSPLSVRGPDWFTDGDHLGPGAADLLTLCGAEHSLGGIHGYTDTGDHRREPRARRTHPAGHPVRSAHGTGPRRRRLACRAGTPGRDQRPAGEDRLEVNNPLAPAVGPASGS